MIYSVIWLMLWTQRDKGGNIIAMTFLPLINRIFSFVIFILLLSFAGIFLLPVEAEDARPAMAQGADAPLDSNHSADAPSSAASSAPSPSAPPLQSTPPQAAQGDDGVNIPPAVLKDAIIKSLSIDGISQSSLYAPPEPKAKPDKTIKKIPAFQFNNIGSHDFVDEVMILNLFSMWCDKCERENALLNAFKLKYNVPIYGVNLFLKDTDEPLAFFGAHGNPFKKWGKDDFNLMVGALHITSVPVTMIITKDLSVHWLHRGELTADIIEGQMVPLLKELSKPRSIFALSHLPQSEPQTGLPYSDAPIDD